MIKCLTEKGYFQIKHNQDSVIRSLKKLTLSDEDFRSTFSCTFFTILLTFQEKNTYSD